MGTSTIHSSSGNTVTPAWRFSVTLAINLVVAMPSGVLRYSLERSDNFLLVSGDFTWPVLAHDIEQNNPRPLCRFLHWGHSFSLYTPGMVDIYVGSLPLFATFGVILVHRISSMFLQIYGGSYLSHQSFYYSNGHFHYA